MNRIRKLLQAIFVVIIFFSAWFIKATHAKDKDINDFPSLGIHFGPLLPLPSLQANPNKLMECPLVDYSTKSLKQRTKALHNCWGSYVITSSLEGEGERLFGEWRNGSLNGYGEHVLPNRDMYWGYFKNGKYHGKGAYHVHGLGYYVGEWQSGSADNSGTFIFENGDQYSGNFKNLKPDGKGLIVFKGSMGGKFVGEVKNGVMHGRGVRTFNDGYEIVGLWKKGIYLFEAKNGAETDSSFQFPEVVTSKINLKTNPNNLPICRYQKFDLDFDGCWGKGDNYIGEVIDGKYEGLGVELMRLGFYVGYFKNNKRHGMGIFIDDFGGRLEGIFQNNEFLMKTQVKLDIINENLSENNFEVENEFSNHIKSKKINLKVGVTPPDTDGAYTVSIWTAVDTASLKINGEELGGGVGGQYTVHRFSRAGGNTQFTIVAADVHGNTETKTITVNRPVAKSEPVLAALNPAQVKKQPERDAVAIIIGIADYKHLPRADFANDDARVFYDYAIRALGVKPENIRLLVDGDADEVAFYRAFKTWLPSRVRASTDVYVYYSGHGLPTADGQGLYLLPQRADRDFIDKTAITQAEINAAIQAAKPKSVTVFLDSCYSGQARSGETLIASARPVALKAEKQLFPDNFTVITASQSDQISSSSPDLKHGIFSYYLMRGMEGDADANRDGKITAGEMQAYLAETVSRQAGMMNRVQQPQLIGDASRVLVGK